MFRKRKPKPVRDTLIEAGVCIESGLGHYLLYELEQVGYVDGYNFEIDLYDIGPQGWGLKGVAGIIYDKIDGSTIAHVEFDEYIRHGSIAGSECYWVISTRLLGKLSCRTFYCQSYYDLLGNRIEYV